MSQVWVFQAPETSTSLLGVFEDEWTPEDVCAAVKRKFGNLSLFTMQRMKEGSMIVQSFEGDFEGSKYDQDLAVMES